MNFRDPLKTLKQENAALRQRVATLEQEVHKLTAHLEQVYHAPDSPTLQDQAVGDGLSMPWCSDGAVERATWHAAETRFFYTLVEHMPDSVLVVTLDNRVIHVNPAFKAQFGCDEVIIGRSTSEAFAAPFWKHLNAVRQHLGEQSRLPTEWQGVLMVPGSEGQTFPAQVSAMLIRDPTGQPCAYAAIFRDITELVRKQEALGASEERLRYIIQHMPVLLHAFDEAGMIVFWNKECERVTGYRAEEMVGNPEALAWLYPDPQARTHVLQRWPGQQGQQQSAEQSWETTLVAKDGSTRTIAWSPIPYMIALPSWAACAAGVDITRRSKAEDALRESEQKFRSAIEQTVDGVAITDGEGHIVEWNDGAEQISGLNRAEVLGHTVWDVSFRIFPAQLKTPKAYDLIQAKARLFFQQGDAPWLNQFQVTECQLPNGEMRYIQQASFPIKTSTGPALCITMRDVTDQKHTEQELRRAWHDAEAATRAKSAFLANMSHEIRTPMNAVIGMTNLLLDTPLTPEQKEYVEIINLSGNSLLTLINDILDFSKIEAGRLELERHPFNIHTCVEEVLELMAFKAEGKGIALVYYIVEDFPTTLIGDSTRLRQILVNLIDNAIKFTDQGEVVVSIERGESRMEHNAPLPPDSVSTLHSQFSIHIAVRDTGIGIPVRKIKHLFQSFSQLDDTMTRRYGGSGLGLAISKRLAETMGGTIWVESNEGKGSTFYVSIVAETTTPEPCPFLAAQQPHLMGKRALIASGSEISCLFLERQTARWGMQPVVVSTAQETLHHIAQTFPFDVILLDDTLPDKDNLTLAREISNNDATCNVPLLVWTSMALRNELFRRGELDIATFLIKPVRISALHHALSFLFQVSTDGKELSLGKKTYSEEHLGQKHPLHILLAEDNTVNQKVALRLLERLGYRADVASNGLEVLHALERRSYDVVLLDIQMPEMDGIEAVQHIRELWPADQHPRLVAMTAHAMKGYCEWLLQKGLDDYISKPVKVEELAAALLKVEKQHTHDHENTSPDTTRRDSPAAAPTPSIDRALLNTFLETIGKSAPSDSRELISFFLKDTARFVETMRHTFDQRDLRACMLSTRSLWSCGSQVGAHRLTTLCKELEMLELPAALARANDLIARIEAEYEHVKAVLEEEKGTHDNSEERP
jgi:PAS domain S-box-containing protein